MSWDFRLRANLGGSEPVCLDILDLNYTYNVSPMIFKACGSTPSDWHGKPAREVSEICAKVLAAFNADPETYRALNPKNGWGDFEGCRQLIGAIKAGCDHAPNAELSVS